MRPTAEPIGLDVARTGRLLNRACDEAHLALGGLVARHREPTNRRNQLVVLTASGEELFERMRTTVVAFDEQLGHGVAPTELDQLRGLLGRLRANVTAFEVRQAQQQ